jgi:Sigma-70 region 2
MRWRAAEQLLEGDREPDRFVVMSSMVTFANDEERCRCASCRPDLFKRNPPAVGTSIPTRDLADALTTLRSSLITAARYQLQNRGLDEQLAEDLVQEAIARWCARAREFRDHHQLYGWLRKTISWLAAEGLRRRDLLDRGCASLDEPWHEPGPEGGERIMATAVK